MEGVYYLIDSMPVKVCENARIWTSKILKGYEKAQSGLHELFKPKAHSFYLGRRVYSISQRTPKVFWL